MTLRNYYHIYQILEEYSKNHISFEYTPEFNLEKNYPLSILEIDTVLKNNGLLIKALYNKDENEVHDILLNNQLPPVGNYLFAQLSKEDAILLQKSPDEMKCGLPLPIQARYVLASWNALRNGNSEEINKLSTVLKQEAFKGSLYTQITLMALSFDCDCFNKIAINTYKTLTKSETYFLYYKILSYYFRLTENKKLKEACISLSKSYKNNLPINKDNENLIFRNLR